MRWSSIFLESSISSKTIFPELPTGANCAGSPNSINVENMSLKSDSCFSSNIELSSTNPISRGSSRLFHPVMKSDPRRPATAKAPGIDLFVLKKDSALLSASSVKPSMIGLFCLPFNQSAIFSYSGSYMGEYNIL